MNIEIRKLTPNLAEDYVHFFDVTPHDNNTDENKCYCVTWRSDDSYIGNGDHWFPSREERRNNAIRFIKNGNIQGYLAYNEGKVVGWCNANTNCQICVNYLRSQWQIGEYNSDIKVKSIFCFTIAPEFQRMGLATKLLKRVCKDAVVDDFDFVEAYVNNEYVTSDCRGPLSMYEKCGFIKYAERENRVVVRKALK